jgi:hypothetical protein
LRDDFDLSSEELTGVSRGDAAAGSRIGILRVI